MERTCFVHIGAPKTGSTFLQRTLAENPAVLAEAGLLYPSSSLRGFGHHDIAFLLAGGYPDWATPQPRPLSELQADLAQEVSAHDGDILLSSEDFYLFPEPVGLKALLQATGASAGRRVRIIVYVRRQDELQEAWYNQRVKAMGETRPIAEALPESAPLWDYRAQLQPWADTFGEEAIGVRRYRPAGQASPTLLEDFLAALGRPGLRLAAPETPVNTRENRDVLEFQRRMNQLPLTPQEKRRFHRQLMTLSERTAGLGLFDQRPLLDEPQRREILQSYAASNTEVARRYLGEPDLFGADAPAPPASTSPIAEEGLTADKLVYILGWILASGEPERQ